MAANEAGRSSPLTSVLWRGCPPSVAPGGLSGGCCQSAVLQDRNKQHYVCVRLKKKKSSLYTLI